MKFGTLAAAATLLSAACALPAADVAEPPQAQAQTQQLTASGVLPLSVLSTLLDQFDDPACADGAPCELNEFKAALKALQAEEAEALAKRGDDSESCSSDSDSDDDDDNGKCGCDKGKCGCRKKCGDNGNGCGDNGDGCGGGKKPGYGYGGDKKDDGDGAGGFFGGVGKFRGGRRDAPLDPRQLWPFPTCGFNVNCKDPEPLPLEEGKFWRQFTKRPSVCTWTAGCKIGS